MLGEADLASQGARSAAPAADVGKSDGSEREREALCQEKRGERVTQGIEEISVCVVYADHIISRPYRSPMLQGHETKFSHRRTDKGEVPTHCQSHFFAINFCTARKLRSNIKIASSARDVEEEEEGENFFGCIGRSIGEREEMKLHFAHTLLLERVRSGSACRLRRRRRRRRRREASAAEKVELADGRTDGRGRHLENDRHYTHVCARVGQYQIQTHKNTYYTHTQLLVLRVEISF